jgi:hypothetical protein
MGGAIFGPAAAWPFHQETEDDARRWLLPMDPKLWVPKQTVMNPDLEQRLAEKKHRLEVYDKVAYLFER